jgi:hypothetical protein
VRLNEWEWLWFPIERRFWSFQEQGFPHNCRITNSVPAVELVWAYRLTLAAENQRQKYAPPAGNGAVSRTWDSRNDPTLKFSESGTSALCLVKTAASIYQHLCAAEARIVTLPETSSCFGFDR